MMDECQHPIEFAARVGYLLAWQCASCGRVEVELPVVSLN